MSLVFNPFTGTFDFTGSGGGGGGTISGTIDTNQLAFGTALDTIGGSNNLTWDGTTFNVGPTPASVVNYYFPATVQFSTGDVFGGDGIAIAVENATYGLGVAVTQYSGSVGYVSALEGQARANHNGNATSQVIALSSTLSANGFTDVEAYGTYAWGPAIDGGTYKNYIAFYAAAAGGIATNAYSFWSDEQGVYRIRSDNTFDSVYQGIAALYNPLFTKYTPGAANYERIVTQWETNVATLTTEKGGTGTLRALNLGDSGVMVTANGRTIATVPDVFMLMGA